MLLNQGVKLGEGKPKEMIDTYKRVLVGQYTVEDAQEPEGTELLEDEQIRALAGSGGKNSAPANVNTELLEY